MSISDSLINEKSEPFLKYLMSGAPQEDAERRDNQRHPLSVTLLVQPLNNDLQPDGNQFRVMTRDVSTDGIGFVHAEPIKHKFLKIVMPDPNRTELVAEVQHCTAVGELGLLYLTGVQVRQDQRPTANDGQSAKSVDRTTMIQDSTSQ